MEPQHFSSHVESLTRERSHGSSISPAQKAYLSLVRSDRPNAPAGYPIVLILRLTENARTAVEKLRDFLKRDLDVDSFHFEEHQSSRAFHFLIYLRNHHVVAKILYHPLKHLSLRSNILGRELDKSAVVLQAQELAG